MTTRAALYARCSSTQQAERDLSIPAQLDHARAFAQAQRFLIVEEYKDEGISGYEADNRPALQRLLADARAARFDVVIVWDLARFSRNAVDVQLLRRQLADLGVRLHSMKEPLEEGASGWLAGSVFSAFNEYQIRKLSEDTQRGMRQNAGRGRYNGGKVPTGYALERDPSGANPRLVEDPDWSPVVRRIFALAIDGLGTSAIARALAADGQLTKRGKTWSKHAVLCVLKNERYTGTAVWGRSRHSKFNHRDPEPVRVPDAHPALVSREDFQRAQVALASRTRARRHPRRSGSSYLLSGLIFCGHCGKAMTGHGAKSNTVFYYGCQTKMKRGADACEAKLLNRERVEAQVLARLRCAVLSSANLDALLDVVNQELRANRRTVDDELGAVEGQLRSVKAKLSNLYDAVASGSIPHEHLAAPIAKWTEAKNDLETRQGELRQRGELPAELSLTREQLLAWVGRLHQLLTEGPVQARRAFLRSWVIRITARSYGDIQVHYTLPSVLVVKPLRVELAPWVGVGLPRMFSTPLTDSMREQLVLKLAEMPPEALKAEPSLTRVLPTDNDGSPLQTKGKTLPLDPH
ncbi:MAG: recombinase family protein [Alphaproteobacteria bacterium]|nr:recombinase family protein [Alphaproteobacteria bacterium]